MRKSLISLFCLMSFLGYFSPAAETQKQQQEPLGITEQTDESAANHVHDNPVEQMVQRVKDMDIVSYRLEWVVSQDGNWEYVTIYGGNDKGISKEIRNAMKNVLVEDSFTAEYIGFLILVNREGLEEKIYITDPGFMPEGGQKSFNGFFASPELARIVKSMVEQSAYKDQILMTEGLFQNLATVYEIPNQ